MNDDSGRVEMTVNLDPSIGLFHRATFAAVGMMRNTLRSIESGSFSENYQVAGYDGLTHSFEIQDLEGIEVEATSVAFCGVVRALIDLLDRFVAIDEVVRKTNAGELAIEPGVPVLNAVAALVDQHIDQVSRDTRLRVPAKIQRICGDSERGADIANVLEAYVRARNSIEHHKSRPRPSIDLTLYSVELLVGGQPIVYGEAVEGGSDVFMRATERTRTLHAGELISFSEQDVSELVYGLMTRLVPGMVSALVSSNKARSPEPPDQPRITP